MLDKLENTTRLPPAPPRVWPLSVNKSTQARVEAPLPADHQTAKAMAQPISIPPMIQHIALMGMRLQQSLVAPTADNAISFVVWLASTIARNSTAVVGTAAAAAGTPARCNPAHTARCGLRCALETYIENKPGPWLDSSTLHGARSQKHRTHTARPPLGPRPQMA